VEVVLKVCKNGKNIEEKFAHKYYDQIGLGIDFTARDLQTKAKEKGLPWALAKGFNSSAPISEFRPKSDYDDMNDLNFSLDIDGKTVQKGNTSLVIFNFNYIITYISKYITLKKGDIIFTGTPKGVGPIKIGNRLEGYLEGEKLLNFEIK
jgi:acylpyruvate hydrolase